MDAFIAGAWRSPGRGEILIGGLWRRVTRAEAYIGGAWRTAVTFTPALTVAADDSNGFGNSKGPVRVTSYPTTATPSGGLAPYTYSWTLLEGSVTITSPNAASTSFSAVVQPSDSITASARVTCTDAAGSTATADIFITLTNAGGF